MQRQKSAPRWPLHERPGHWVSRLSRLMTRFAESRFQSLGTGVAGYPVLNLLHVAGKMTQKELVERLGVEQSSMAQLVGRLERDGFVIRRKDPADGRSSFVKLTRKGILALPLINDIMDEGNDIAVKGLSHTEVDVLLRLLRKMVGNFEHAARAP